MNVAVRFLTPASKAQEQVTEAAIRDLESICPPDQPCWVSVYEVAEDALVHATVVQAERPLVWSDWEVSVGEQVGTAVYEKSFGPPDPSTEDLVESIRRVIRAHGKLG